MSGKKGFTLIELLVAIAIIGILAATAVVNIAKNADQDVRMEKDRLTTFLRGVQNKALTGGRAGIPAGRKVCGFGFEKSGSNITSYYIYDTDLDADCGASWKTYTKSSDYSTFYPTNGVVINFPDDCMVFFHSPDGSVDWKGGCSLPLSISLSKSGASVSIIIGSGGNIN